MADDGRLLDTQLRALCTDVYRLSSSSLKPVIFMSRHSSYSAEFAVHPKGSILQYLLRTAPPEFRSEKDKMAPGRTPVKLQATSSYQMAASSHVDKTSTIPAAAPGEPVLPDMAALLLAA